MYREIVHALGSFHHCLGDRRVRVHRSSELVCGRFELHRYARFGDQFGRMWTNDVHAQNLVVLLLTDDFYKPFFLADDARLAGSGERKPSYLHIIALLLRSRFSEPNGTDFRIAVSAVWHETQIDRPYVLLPREMLDGDDPLFRSEVGQQRRRHNVAYRIHTFLRGLLEFIDLDKSLFEFDLRTFESKAFGVRHAPDCNQQHLRFESN